MVQSRRLARRSRTFRRCSCLRKAIVGAPDYIDAMFNLALLLQRKGSYAEATDCWRRYLASDHASEWAGRARRSLKFCEIQLNSLTGRSESQADSDRAGRRWLTVGALRGRFETALVRRAAHREWY